MLLSIDWDFFVPEFKEWEIQHREDKLYTDTMWEIRAVKSNLLDEMTTNGEEEDFWERIKDNFDLSEAVLVVTDSHKASYELAVNSQIKEVVSFDAHCDLYYSGYEQLLKETEVSCDNWLGMLIRDNKIEKASIVLSDESNEWGEIPTELYFDLYVPYLPLPFKKKKVKVIHICRSGAWTPPWLDDKFKKFVQDSGKTPLIYAVPERTFNEEAIRASRKEMFR